MPAMNVAGVAFAPALLDAIASFPVVREVHHCGTAFPASPFDIYATCPVCGARVKVRSFAAAPELADVFDAVFAWMARPGAAELVRDRQRALAADPD